MTDDLFDLTYLLDVSAIRGGRVEHILSRRDGERRRVRDGRWTLVHAELHPLHAIGPELLLLDSDWLGAVIIRRNAEVGADFLLLLLVCVAQNEGRFVL